MELRDDESIRYAFLLGSALRNQDSDRFLEVYDTIKPGSLSFSQIDGIKDRARVISDLPEDEYNALVVQARDFSLTQSGDSLAMFSSNTDCSISTGTSATSSAVGDRQSGKMEEDVSSSGCDGNELEMASSSLMSNDDRNAIVFDYIEAPSPSDQFNKSLPKYCKPYDEVHPVDSSAEHRGLGHCVASPVMSEMTTYCIKTSPAPDQLIDLHEHNKCVRQRNTETSDEAYLCDSDSGDDRLVSVRVESDHVKLGSMNIHKHLYSNTSNEYFGCTDKEDYTQRYDGSCNGVREGKNRSMYGSNTGSVDKTVNFPLKHEVKPPFGDPLNTNKLENAIVKLIDGRRQNDTIPNLPAAESVTYKSSLHGAITSQEDSDRKKKKKKDKKGDGAEDENGNPLTAGNEGSGSERHSQSKFPRNTEQLAKLIPGDKDNGEEAMSPPTASQQTKKVKRRKDPGIKAETIPGHVGDKSVDELVSYIDGRSSNVSSGGCHKTAQHSSNVVSLRTNRYKASAVVTTQSSATSLQDHLSHGTQPKTDVKTKAKKKHKSGAGMTTKSSLEVEEKPSHGSEGEYDVMKDKAGEDSTSSEPLEGGTSVSSTKASSLAGEEGATSPDNPFDSTDESYIFTDLPVAQKEEQFTVVNKSKKRKKNFLSSRELPPREVATFHKEDVPSRRRSRPQTRSFTPPPSTSASSKPDRSSERALSPSSFPVLGNPREARRNSTGNLAELERSYDSDRESVKSVPPSTLADGSRSGMDISPASYKPPSVSYATIAAGRRSFLQNNGASGQEADKPPDTCKPVDKPPGRGSPLFSQSEHQGSSDGKQNAAVPEVAKGGCSNSRPSSASHSNNCAKVKLSQSADTAQSTSNPTASSDGAVTPGCSPSICSSSVVPETANATDTMAECHGDTIDQSAERNAVKPESADVELNMNNAVEFPALTHTSPVKQVDQSDGRERAAATTSASSSKPQPAQHCKMSLPKSASTNSSEPKHVTSKPPTAPTRNASLKSKTKSSTKSVIFMDRRMNDQPLDLDITFGFEPGFDSSVVIPVRIDSSSTCSSDSGRDTDSDSATFHVTLNKDLTNPESISLSVEQGSGADSATVRAKTSNNSGNNVQCMNIRSKLQNMRRHGQLVFIGPEQPDINVSASGEMCHAKLVRLPNGIVSPMAQHIQSSLPNNTVVTENHIIVGNHGKPREDVHADVKSMTSDEAKDKSEKIAFSYDRAKDPQFQPGGFNHEAGVAFLYTEWQKLENSAVKYDPSEPVAC